ncbi:MULTISPECIES: ThiF family adenylyltransferase [Enterobacteriaceae]|uniref:ThiF family adenylyltransferase n=1 Tax=Enterobacteriaceae TaxID=543 RepID=UPI0006A5726E|nr:MULTISPECIES: ThiF family adenylyltransferase [Enterobacteriaceae]HBX4416843.1 ThiF family adenylyltransferase [Klebsiella pneumoniae]HDR2359844.1 ThiF family adenylyltransferase [Enterobacter kobei]MEB6423708.1 ThiF family adenylyltransferase [Enterobacter hormaechei subsp. xiangfangensis]RYA58244.1 ThiF family adenylyltransferase [Enterobacter cloacae complex sp. 4DZ3-28B]RYA75816.1 ThiF family adenylyltransferase [Enterobacter cloacae complex sp. 4DZ3-17B2]
MNYSAITDYLAKRGYKVSAYPAETDQIEFFRIELEIGDFPVTLIHYPVKEITGLPIFLLVNPSALPRLAHTTVYEEIGFATICVNVPDAVSVNYECPELAFEESLKRHITLLTRALTDRDWNTQELLREFEAGWGSIIEPETIPFLCLSDEGEAESLSVFKPRKNAKAGLNTYFLGYREGWNPDALFSPLSQILKEREETKGNGFVIPLKATMPAPWQKEELAQWYLELLQNLPQDLFTMLTQRFGQQRAREFWLIFNAQTPSGKTWFGIHFALKNAVQGKKHLPFKASHIEEWVLKALPVLTFNKERLMPRSGANQSLLGKKVMLVGCGSVGGEVADKLAASGVGHIHLCDPDSLSLNNLYRHILPPAFVSCPKTVALWLNLNSKYPWLEITGDMTKLLALRDRKTLSTFDLIIIAIGSPTQERMFHDYLIKEKIKVPVINTWVEGYGVGGHAVLDIPGTPGCLRCAYVDSDNFSRGLSSNLNFLATNQDLTRNHAGCGDAFLPYSYTSSTLTALITVDLAVKYLSHRVNVSSRVSWKGSSEDAIEYGFVLSERYHAFNRSLEILPLYNPECDICNG